MTLNAQCVISALSRMPYHVPMDAPWAECKKLLRTLDTIKFSIGGIRNLTFRSLSVAQLQSQSFIHRHSSHYHRRHRRHRHRRLRHRRLRHRRHHRHHRLCPIPLPTHPS